MSSLYTICLDRIYGFLTEGMWKSCTPNPFSDLPTKFVNELMDLSDNKKDSSKIADVLPLLSSGRLTRLDLCPFDLLEEYFIAETIQRVGSNSPPNIFSQAEESILHFLWNVISWNPYLEEFHSKVHPGFDVFRKCPNLRILKIHDSFSKFRVNNFPINLSVMSFLRNREVLYVSNMDADTIASVLETCPKLISIGPTDSLDSFEKIAKRRQKNTLPKLDVDRHFQLRRCVWGKGYRSESREERQEYNFSIRGKIRSAVEFCPLVQELVIYVHQKDGYEALKFLKQLTILRIYFEKCGDILPEFFALLREIEPQLKHLSLFGEEYPRIYPVPVDVICECCPSLQSLEIWGSISVKDSSKPACDLTLKRLKLFVEETDNEEVVESLLFLLCNSKHLEELYITWSYLLDDALLNRIFERNPFSQLKVIFIEECGVTREGFQIILEKSASIETVLILADREEHFHGVDRFKNSNLRFSKDFYFEVKLKEFFYCRLNEERF